VERALVRDGDLALSDRTYHNLIGTLFIVNTVDNGQQKE